MSKVKEDPFEKLFKAYDQIFDEGDTGEIPKNTKDFEENFKHNPTKLQDCMECLKNKAEMLSENSSIFASEDPEVENIQEFRKSMRDFTGHISNFIEGIENLNKHFQNPIDVKPLKDGLKEMNDRYLTSSQERTEFHQEDGVKLLYEHTIKAHRLDLISTGEMERERQLGGGQAARNRTIAEHLADIEMLGVAKDRQDFEDNFRHNPTKLQKYLDFIKEETVALTNKATTLLPEEGRTLVGKRFENRNEQLFVNEHSEMVSFLQGVDSLKKMVTEHPTAQEIDPTIIARTLDIKLQDIKKESLEQTRAKSFAQIRDIDGVKSSSKLNRFNPEARMDHRPAVFTPDEGHYPSQYKGRGPGIGLSATAGYSKKVGFDDGTIVRLRTEERLEGEKEVRFNTPREQREYIAQQSNSHKAPASPKSIAIIVEEAQLISPPATSPKTAQNTQPVRSTKF